MRSEPAYHLRLLKRKYLLLRIGEGLIWSLAAGSLLYGLLLFIPLNQYLKYVIIISISLLVFIVLGIKRKFFFIQNSDLVIFINRKYPVMESSADLLLKRKEALPRLQQLQYERVEQKLLECFAVIRFPHHLFRASAALVLAVFSAAMLSAFIPGWNTRKQETSKGETNIPARSTAPIPVVIHDLNIEVVPPSYTGYTPSVVKDPALSILEGTSVTWSIRFSKNVKEASLLFGKADSVMLQPSKKKNFSGRKNFHRSDFYQIRWKDENGKTTTSDYFRIEVTKDQPPEIRMIAPPLIQEFTWKDKPVVGISSSISDDYGLKAAYVIATVSKGSGESVKFREEKISFTSPKKIAGKTVGAMMNLDLQKLGLEPGDELYFYVAAVDNKLPVPNTSRTETYFVTLQDTTTQELSFEGGLGIDLMPEYFRSQRQIIIDSEKLLKDKRNISREVFNTRSNTLAHDQKLLRLKYGEFLGEEFESGIALETERHEAQEHETAEDVTTKFGHVHDKDNDHHMAPEERSGNPPEHKHGKTHDEDKEDPLEAFVHMHDDVEEATFFVQSVRTKLKAALTIMWDAELHLRLNDPRKSLPYQYKALKLLKEISNDSRIYVHKTGFDAPPLKEEKRLTGELTDVKPYHIRNLNPLNDPYPALQAGLKVTESLLQNYMTTVSDADKKILTEAAKTLAVLALEYPARYMEGLTIIKRITEDQISRGEIKPQLTTLRRTFWLALPNEVASPGKAVQATHFLDKALIDQSKAEWHE